MEQLNTLGWIFDEDSSTPLISRYYYHDLFQRRVYLLSTSSEYTTIIEKGWRAEDNEEIYRGDFPENLQELMNEFQII